MVSDLTLQHVPMMTIQVWKVAFDKERKNGWPR